MPTSRACGKRLRDFMFWRQVALCLLVSVLGTAAQADPFSDCTSKTDLELRIRGCTQFIDLGPGNTRQLYFAYNLRGSAFAQRRDYDRAIADFTRGLELDASDAVIYAARGEAYRHKGELNRAIMDFNKSIELDPNNGNAYHARGLAYFMKRDHARAIADLSKAIEINPKSAAAIHDRGVVYGAIGKKE